MTRPSLKTYRRTVQLGVLAAFIVIPSLNRHHIQFVYGNFLSFNAAGLPLADPLAVLQVLLKDWTASSDLLIGAAIALALAAALGTVFCSWLCPFGLLSEWAFELSRRFALKKPAHSSTTATRRGLFPKAFLLGIGLLAFLSFSTASLLNQLSLPAWYSRIFQLYFVQSHLSLAALVLLAVLILEALARNRFWCRYVCPQSVLPALAKLANPLRLQVSWNASRCRCNNTRSSPCQTACSLSIDPKALGRAPETECNNCGDCVVACRHMGRALGFQFGQGNAVTKAEEQKGRRAEEQKEDKKGGR